MLCLSCFSAGHFVSGLVKKQLPMLLVSHMSSGSNGGADGSSGSSKPGSVQQALRGAFLEVDANLAASNIDCEFSGCTCAVAHLQVRILRFWLMGTVYWSQQSGAATGRHCQHCARSLLHAASP